VTPPVHRSPDLLVVGAGPAGGALALLAARRGLDVVIVEAKRFPRDKVCGEFVSAEGCAVLKRLGVLPALTGASETRTVDGVLPRIDRWRVTAPDGRAVEGALPDFPGLGGSAIGWSRAAMDAALLDAARRAGATVLQPWTFADTQFERGRVHEAIVHPAGDPARAITLQPRVLVAADGRRSRLARTLHPPRTQDPSHADDGWWGIKTHRRGTPGTGPARDRVDLHLFRDGYLGVGGLEGNLTNLCLLVRRRALLDARGDLDGWLRRRAFENPVARAELECLEPASRWHAVGPLRFGPRRAAARGVWFAGDAAGTVDPFSGEGISHALLSAEALAPLVEGAAAAGGVRVDGRAFAQLSKEWEATWHASFAAASRRTRWVGRLLGKPRLASLAVRTLASRPAWAGTVARWTRTASTARP